jgi:Alpha-L-arabinofuranosidase C-terminal domain
MRNLCLFVFILIVSALARAQEVVIQIDPSQAIKPISRFLTGACLEDVNHEIYGGLYSQMIFGESFQEPGPSDDPTTSGMWRPFHRSDAIGATAITTDHPFVGAQSQRFTYVSGAGDFGIENRGLNRQGLNILANRLYHGHLWARTDDSTTIEVSLASADGTDVLTTSKLIITDKIWRRYDFALTPRATDAFARFEICLHSLGSVDIGYVFLNPGPWGTFDGLPVRKDVAEALIGEGITAIRYGGSMVNTDEYRWKKMIGDRDRRSTYLGHWYPQSTNGWGIIDFLNFSEAAGFLPVPDFNIDESPQDMADFIEYANGPITSPWGARRAADGHPAPYHLTHLELGNEERVDENYYTKFQSIARAIWMHDPKIILAVGDFHYSKPIVDPLQFDGADSGITSLSAHRKILDLARQFDAEVWFDIHVWTGVNPEVGGIQPWHTYVDAIDKLAGNTRHHVVIFELNANSHDQFRALANAQTILAVERDGRMPFLSSANCLQIDHQNSNGWDQGLLFLNSTSTWLQPPGYVWQMISRNYEPHLLHCTVSGQAKSLEAVATARDDRKLIVVQIVNISHSPVTAQIRFDGPATGNGIGETLAADDAAVNTADAPHTVVPTILPASSGNTFIFPARSFSIVRWRNP